MESSTDVGGLARFCYTVSDLPGQDEITARVQGGTNPTATATVRIVAPQSTAYCRARYVGRIVAASGNHAVMSGFASVLRGDPRGDQNYVELGSRTNYRVDSRTVDALRCDANGASIFGQAKGKNGDWTYRIDLEEGARGRAGRFRIRLGNGYDSGDQGLRSGFVDVER